MNSTRRKIALLFTLLCIDTLSGMHRSCAMQEKLSNAFEELPPELREAILLQTDPALLQNAITFIDQQPTITLVEDARVRSVAIRDNKIITWAADYRKNNATVKIWDLRTGKCIHTLITPDNFVDEPCSLATHNNKIAVGFSDNTIKIWDINTYECLSTIIGPKTWDENHNDNRIRSLAIDGNTVIAAVGKVAKIWNILSGECVCTLPIMNASITSIATNGNMIGTGLSDGTVKIWDYTGTCIRSFKNFKGRSLDESPVAINSIAINKDKIAAVTQRGIGNVWDINTGSCLFSLDKWGYKTHMWSYCWGCNLSSLAMDNEKIIIGSAYTAIVLNVTNGNLIRTLEGPKKKEWYDYKHVTMDYSVDICDNNIAITESAKKTAKIWLLANLQGSADTDPLVWIKQKGDLCQLNFIRRAYEATNAGQDFIIALPKNFNNIDENESCAERDGRIYFSLPCIIREYLRTRLNIRK